MKIEKPEGPMVYTVIKGANTLPFGGLKFQELKKKLRESVKKELEWSRTKTK